MRPLEELKFKRGFRKLSKMWRNRAKNLYNTRIVAVKTLK